MWGGMPAGEGQRAARVTVCYERGVAAKADVAAVRSAKTSGCDRTKSLADAASGSPERSERA
jgi:hypothetical protein